MPVPGAAVQVTERVVPAAASRSSRAVQPGIDSVLAEATLGRATLNCVVRAPFSDSLGTLKVSTDSEPGAGLSASTLTWAHAGAVPASRPMDIAAPVAAMVIGAREVAPEVNASRSWLSVVVGTALSRRGGSS